MWQRPTWPLRHPALPLRRPLQGRGLFGFEDEAEPGRNGDGAKHHHHPASPEARALAVFNLEPPFSLPGLKTRYKELVKLQPSRRAWRRQGCRRASQGHQPGLCDAQSQLLPPPEFFPVSRGPTSSTLMTPTQNTASPADNLDRPDITVSVRQTFGIDSDMQVPAFSRPSDHVPDIDEAYRFDRDTTLAILAGFAYNRRVMIQGYHGTGKSTHIEQVAARLNWPCIRVNLDSHISRIDLVGKDAIVLRDGKQVTEFREGLLPWALQHPTALVLRRIRCRPARRDVRDPARARGRGQADPARPEPRHPAASGLPPVRHRQHGRAWATPPASITARSRSTRARWTAGTSSRRSITCRTTPRSRSCWPRRRATTTRKAAARSTPWWRSPS